MMLARGMMMSAESEESDTGYLANHLLAGGFQFGDGIFGYAWFELEEDCSSKLAMLNAVLSTEEACQRDRQSF